MQFQEEDKSGIVPIKRLKPKDVLRVGEECEVIWSDRKVYFGVIICSGMNL